MVHFCTTCFSVNYICHSHQIQQMKACLKLVIHYQVCAVQQVCAVECILAYE